MLTYATGEETDCCATSATSEPHPPHAHSSTAASGGGCAAGESEDVKSQDVKGGGVDAFIAAKSFGGSRAGYVFKAGARGQGYYADVETAGSSPSSSPAL